VHGFSGKPRELPSLMLCGNPLPCVDKLLYLGNMISNKIDGCRFAMKQEDTMYIEKNCTINQEFSFAHPSSRFLVNKIYHCPFSGCQLLNLFSKGADKFYSTFNCSMKVMADLPFGTHRNLSGAVSGQQHMSLTLIRNYLNFIQKVRKSFKQVMKQLYSVAKSDVCSTTGSNLRNILLLTDLSSIDDLKPSTVVRSSTKKSWMRTSGGSP
jgi:hypothetical protein